MKRVLFIAAVWMLVVWTAALLFARAPAAPGSPPPASGNPLDRWDANFYRALAGGDASAERRDAFFPLFPTLVRSGMTISGWSFGTVSGVLNSLVTLLDVFLFSSLLRRFTTEDTSLEWPTLAFLALPTSFVLLAPYPVALLVLFTLLTWLGVKERRPLLIGVSGSMAALTHPTGSVLFLIALLILLRRPRQARHAAAITLMVLTAVYVISSGLVSRFLMAQQGFTIYAGVPFWQVGFLYLTHYNVSLALRALQLLAHFVHLVLAGIAIQAFWRTERWFAVTSLTLMLVAVVSGAWMSLSRYLLPVFLVPMLIARWKPVPRLIAVVLSFSVQIAWLYAFVTWTSHV